MQYILAIEQYLDYFDRNIQKYDEYYAACGSIFKITDNEFDNFISIDQIINNYVDFIFNHFSAGIKDFYGISEAVMLPSISSFLSPETQAIKLDDHKSFFLSKKDRNSTVYERIFSKITEIISNEIEQRYIHYKYGGGYITNIDGAIFFISNNKVQFINSLTDFNKWIEILNNPNRKIYERYNYYSLDKIEETARFYGNIMRINEIPDYVNLDLIKNMDTEGIETRKFKVTKAGNKLTIKCDSNLLHEFYYEKIFNYIQENTCIKINSDTVKGKEYNISDSNIFSLVLNIVNKNIYYNGLSIEIIDQDYFNNEYIIKFK